MMPKPKPNPFSGRWRIVSMSAWDDEYINEEEEGFFEFDEKVSGQFHFGYVHGHMDCRLPHGMASQRSSGPGMGTMNWKRRKVEVGPS